MRARDGHGQLLYQIKATRLVSAISTESSINPTGRSSLMTGLVSDHNLVLSNGMRLSDLNVNFSLSKSDSKPIVGNDQPLEHGVGLFMFFQQQARVGGWFCLEAKCCEEVWDQVREGKYTDCVIDIEVGPVGFSGSAWDVEARVFFLSVAVCFHHKLNPPG